MHQAFSALHDHLKESKKIVLIPHQHPDGDAMGSATAFLEYLTCQGKECTIFCATPVGDKWHFLHRAHHATNDPAVLSHPDIDTIIVLDSGDLKYAGVEHLLKDHPATIVNIDHHTTNQHFGHINVVNPAASSTSEILYRFFKHTAAPLNDNMATSLLTGFITDTDNFTNAATSADAMAFAGDLVDNGGDIHRVNDLLVKNKTVDSLKLWGKALERLKKHDDTDLTYTYITRDDLKETNASDSESEGIANFLNNLGDTKIALILKETIDGKIKGSFRTIRDDVDVSEIAKRMGGGGHRRAAGFTAEGSMKDILGKIINAAKT